MATNRLPAASRNRHGHSTINLEIGVRPQAACGSTLTFDEEIAPDPLRRDLTGVCSDTVTLKAVIHEDEAGGFWAEVPSLPGCVTQGESMAELKENIREAISAWLEAAEPNSSLSPTDQILEVAV